jgi:beta-mannosidase
MMTKQIMLYGLVSLLMVCTRAVGADESVHSKPTKTVVPLNAGWEFRQRVTGAAVVPVEWRPAQVPGVVHTDLLRNKLIPDPFYRDNEEKLQWIENADWEYRLKLAASPELLSREHVDLVFEGLDTLADVYVNGSLVLKADNMFREWRVDVKPLLKPSDNEILVVFPSIITGAAKVAEADKWHQVTHPQPPEKAYIRKAAYEYGALHVFQTCTFGRRTLQRW